MIILRAKYTYGPLSLKILFFRTRVSIRIKDGTFVLEKNQISTLVKFSIQKLTVCHVSTPEG
jgi:hypothetical protein